MSGTKTLSTKTIQGGISNDAHVADVCSDEFSLQRAKVNGGYIGNVVLDSLVVAGSDLVSIPVEGCTVGKLIVGPSSKLTGMFLDDCDVTEQAAILFTKIKNCLIHGSTLCCGQIYDSEFENTVFVDVMFSEIKFRNTAFRDCVFTGCTFVDCDLDNLISEPMFVMCDFQPKHVLGHFSDTALNWPTIARKTVQENSFIRCELGQVKSKFRACKGISNIKTDKTNRRRADTVRITVPEQKKVTVPMLPTKAKNRPYRFTTNGIAIA